MSVVLNGLGVPHRRAKTAQKPPTVDEARAVVAKAQRLSEQEHLADQESHRWIAPVREAEAAGELLASGRVAPDQLAAVRKVAAGYTAAASNRQHNIQLRRRCEAQRYQLQLDEPEAFSLWSELYVKQYVEKRDAMLPLLREAMSAYDAAVNAWGSFRRARVEIARTPNADVRRLNDMSHCPAPPVDSEVLAALMNVLPRPAL
jgi:hypothetical protein